MERVVDFDKGTLDAMRSAYWRFDVEMRSRHGPVRAVTVKPPENVGAQPQTVS